MGSIPGKAAHLFQLFHEVVRMCLAADTHLHQHLPYKVFRHHYKELGILMGMLCHHSLLARLEEYICLEVGTRLRPLLLYIFAHEEHTLLGKLGDMQFRHIRGVPQWVHMCFHICLWDFHRALHLIHG